MNLLYIDPATGSMLFSIVIGAVFTASFFFRGLFLKLKLLLTGGRAAVREKDKVPFLIYSDDKRYWNVFGPICGEFERRKIPVRYWTASEDDPVFSGTWKYVAAEFIGEGNKGFLRLNRAKAQILLSTTPGLDVLQWKRSRDVDYYVHIPHSVNTILGYRMFGIDFYDALLASGQVQVDEERMLEEVRKLPAKEIVLTGQPYLDSMLRRLEEQGGDTASGAADKKAAGEQRRTVLLAPTWGKSGILSRFGEKILDALLATGYEVIVRPHPQSFTADREMIDALMKKYPDSQDISWNRDTDNFDVLNRSDIMITDFSSVLYDYTLIFNKPAIYADVSFDARPYDSAWVDDSRLWKFTVLPTLGRELKEEDFPRMKEVLDQTIGSDVYAEGRDRAREYAWANQGNAAVSVVDYLVRKQEDLAQKPEDRKQKQE